MNIEEYNPNIITLECPEELVEALKRVNDIIIKSYQEKQDWDFRSGYLPPMDLSKKDELFFETFKWLVDTNQIIENIKIVFSDLSLYKDKKLLVLRLLGGDKKDRFYLLVRTFFYEFFRIKEVFSLYLNFLRKNKLITKKEATEISLDFYKDYEIIFNLRNSLVHQRHVWRGEDHHNYFLTTAGESIGLVLEHRETGEIINSSEVVAKLALEKIFALSVQTEAIVHDLQSVVNAVCTEIGKEV